MINIKLAKLETSKQRTDVNYKHIIEKIHFPKRNPIIHIAFS